MTIGSIVKIRMMNKEYKYLLEKIFIRGKALIENELKNFQADRSWSHQSLISHYDDIKLIKEERKQSEKISSHLSEHSLKSDFDWFRDSSEDSA